MVTNDKVYKYLSSASIQQSVNIYPLAPRLDTLEGKTIHLRITGEPDITLTLEKLKTNCPNVNCLIKRTYGIARPK